MKGLRRFALVPFSVATGTVATVILLGSHAPVRAGPYGWLDTGTARAVATASRLCGWPVTSDGPVVAHESGFAMEIYYRCTGLLPAAFVGVAVLAFPVAARLRWKGFVGGVLLVLAVNFARLVGLMAVGIELPRHFDVSHRVVGEWLIILAVFVYWLLWARWAMSAEDGEGVR